MRLYTIGHSTRTLDELVDALRSFGIRLLVDIRTIPRSRHTPQFNREALHSRLPRRGIRYAHLGVLGGLRKPRRDSHNTAWRNASFRGFADYMETPEFAEGLRELRTLARNAGPAAFMCAEAVPWRCHRSLVADALTARGDAVLHIMGPGKARRHGLSPWARLAERGRVTYPGLPLAAHGGPEPIAPGGPPSKPEARRSRAVVAPPHPSAVGVRPSAVRVRRPPAARSRPPSAVRVRRPPAARPRRSVPRAEQRRLL